MSRTERTGIRSWAWSVFHRSMPKPAYMIDMDYLECCQYCKETIMIGELARDIGQQFKPTTILQKLAQNTHVVGLLIFLDEDAIIAAVKSITGNLSKESTPILTKSQLQALWRYLTESEVPILRIRQVYPSNNSEQNLTARQFYKFICETHQAHEHECPVALRQFPIFGGTR